MRVASAGPPPCSVRPGARRPTASRRMLPAWALSPTMRRDVRWTRTTSRTCAWRGREYGDPRSIVTVVEVSAKVSTNRVYRLVLDDDQSVIAKVSSYGSYFLFREDHDRIHRTREALQETRWSGLLADVLTERPEPPPAEPPTRTRGRPARVATGPFAGQLPHVFTFYDGGLWTAFYQDVPQRLALPRVYSPTARSPTSARRWVCSTVTAPRSPGGSRRRRSRSSPMRSTCSSCCPTSTPR